MITLETAAVTFSSPGKAYQLQAETNFAVKLQLGCASRELRVSSPCCNRRVILGQGSRAFDRCSVCDTRVPPTLTAALSCYDDGFEQLIPWLEGRVRPLESVLVAQLLWERLEAMFDAHTPYDPSSWSSTTARLSGLLWLAP